MSNTMRRQECRVELAGQANQDTWPATSRGLRERGAAAVLMYGGPGQDLHWLDSVHATGWVRGRSNLAAGELAAAWDGARGQGFVAADAVLLALAGSDPLRLPLLSWDAWPPAAVAPPAAVPAPLGLYAIVDSVPALRQVLAAGIATVQLRIKQPGDADAAWQAGLRAQLREGIAATRAAGATLFVNDHWRLAAELGAQAVHLGQEDLAALSDEGRAALRATGLQLGVSSHAVWELCCAIGLAPRYVACGPVWPTVTKDMPWRPQGLDNLAWWCRAAGRPVVAIGGILTPRQVRSAARSGADGVCVLRGLWPDPRQTVPALKEAFELGRQERDGLAPAWPHPTLEPAA
ncbi:thiamine phosphate synthase [Ramlibacter tataouinensis]|uniref:Thiamine-phosphate synthase n=1 Tax=Ramlibacter tataouinensis (strain ATCC BAA-407 / DSM 14655 / LMG 21543 / TTB310) TaxID=365046 RepID=F5Y0G2_RAMTT|nr:thiamine phosphate synthase [Ramlibacter tataouinensis]AEG93368.1 Thiamine-phosphate synthase [Ramlibacter tataouinensis TTB310]